MLTLYTYWRSTTSYRVRIALAMKGLDYKVRPINLVSGAQSEPDYTALNPIEGVPTLVLEDGTVLTQSMAILDYLDHLAPKPLLLPGDDPVLRAQILAASMVIAADIHPVNNLKVVNRLKTLVEPETAPEIGIDWMRHWMREGFRAFDALIEPDTPFCFGETPTLADVCLIPQLYNAHRWELDLSETPRLLDIEQRCLSLPAFDVARPENQQDAS